MEYKFSDKMDNLKASIIREIFKFSVDKSVISFSAGNPSAEAFPSEIIRTITNDILEKTPVAALQYGITEGYPKLREDLKEYLNKKSIGRLFDDLIIVSGAQQGIDLAVKAICQKGDTVICEAPSFVGSLNAFKSSEVNITGIPMDDDGINIELLEKALQSEKNVKIIYLIPNFQNPSGITMSRAKRRECYNLATKYNVLIIEDNPYGDLRYEGDGIQSIKSMDEDGAVIYCGSFSKIISPGLRVGYVVAPAAVTQKIVILKQTNDVHTSMLSQMICDKFLTSEYFENHLENIRDINRRKYTLIQEQIRKFFTPDVICTEPKGGLFIWATLPKEKDMLTFCKRAVQEYKVAVVPGNAFMVSENNYTNSFRINFSAPSNDQIVKGVELLGKLMKADL